MILKWVVKTPDERARHDAKKREEQEQRAYKLQGLQHMKIKIPQKDPEDEEDSQVKQQAELSQLTGQVGQSEANAGANLAQAEWV